MTQSDALTAEQIAAIEERCNDASPLADESGWEIGWIRQEVIGGNRDVFAGTGPFCENDGSTPPRQAKRDATFIAAARADVPRLLVSHAALRDRLARAEERERGLAEENGRLRTELLLIAGDWQMVCRQNERLRERVYALATPTDGAAPPRRSADGEGDD
jgi:hypothetical protein